MFHSHFNKYFYINASFIHIEHSLKMKKSSKGRKALKSKDYLAKKIITLRRQISQKENEIKRLKEELNLLKKQEIKQVEELISLENAIKGLQQRTKANKREKAL